MCGLEMSLRFCREGLQCCSGSSTRVPESAQSFAARDVPHLAAKPREAFPDPSSIVYSSRRDENST